MQSALMWLQVRLQVRRPWSLSVGYVTNLQSKLCEHANTYDKPGSGAHLVARLLVGVERQEAEAPPRGGTVLAQMRARR